MAKKVVGSRMKEKRLELGLTQKEVAKKAGISDRDGASNLGWMDT